MFNDSIILEISKICKRCDDRANQAQGAKAEIAQFSGRKTGTQWRSIQQRWSNPMRCHVCSFLNDATSAVCVQCRSTLIHEAVGHSSAYITAERQIDTRIYSSTGAVLGFLISAGLFKFVLVDLLDTDKQAVAYSLGGAVVGSLLGRLALHFRRRAL